MKIAGRQIGPDQPVYVIAEIGVNHDGDVHKALMLTQAAAEAGADAVKLQYFQTDRLMSRAARLAAYQKAAGESDPVAMLRRLELGLDEMGQVADRAHELGVHAIATIFSVELVEAATALPWDALKTASPDIIHRPLLDALAATGLPLILSTGASTIDEVRRAAEWLAFAHGRTAFLQCVSSYPTPPELAALGGIASVAAAVGALVGYSDHTPGVETGARAVAAGADILEKHLTYDRSAPGPDHRASLEPDEMAEYVRLARRAPRRRWGGPAAADGGKGVLEIERDVRLLSRQSVVAVRDLSAGHVLERNDVTFKRPGMGLEPWRIAEILGRPLAADVEADLPISSEAVEVRPSALVICRT